MFFLIISIILIGLHLNFVISSRNDNFEYLNNFRENYVNRLELINYLKVFTSNNYISYKLLWKFLGVLEFMVEKIVILFTSLLWFFKWLKLVFIWLVLYTFSPQYFYSYRTTQPGISLRKAFTSPPPPKKKNIFSRWWGI